MTRKQSKASRRAKQAASPPAETPAEPETLEDRVKAIHAQLTGKISAEANGLLEILGSRRRLMWVNFLAGLARGVGFFLGVTLIGALVLALIGFFFNTAAERLGYKDITLESAVRKAVAQFTEIQKIVGEAKSELEEAQDGTGTPPGGTGPVGTTGATGGTGETGGEVPPPPDLPPDDGN
jgi:hypothetical protein